MMSEKIWDVFVSYKRNPDEQIALDLLGALERSGLKCWIAPRDVRATSQIMIENGITSDGGWDDTIPYAVEKSRTMVIVVSKAAMESKQIQKEIYLGDDIGVQFFPVLTEDVPLERSFKYHLGRAQWINCFSGAGSQRFLNVASEISGVLGLPLSNITDSRSQGHAPTVNIDSEFSQDIPRGRLVESLERVVNQSSKVWVGKKSRPFGLEAPFLKNGCYMTIVVKRSEVRVMFWTRFHNLGWRENLAEMNKFSGCRTKLEQVVAPCRFVWDEPREDKVTAYIEFSVPGGYASDESDWPEIGRKLIQAFVPFEATLRREMEKDNPAAQLRDVQSLHLTHGSKPMQFSTESHSPTTPLAESQSVARMEPGQLSRIIDRDKWVSQSSPSVLDAIERLLEEVSRRHPTIEANETKGYFTVHYPNVGAWTRTNLCVWPQVKSFRMKGRIPRSQKMDDYLSIPGITLESYNDQKGRYQLSIDPTAVHGEVLERLLAFISESIHANPRP